MTEPLAWGARVSAPFRSQVIGLCALLQVEPSDLMACMAFESGETFSPSVRNAAGSGAVGLIQFMPSTAAALGTSVETLAGLSAEMQLLFVEKYFRPWRGKLKTLGDVYMAILWPGGVGKADDHVLFDRRDPHHPRLYIQNAGLDFNRDGKVTRGEACARVLATLAKGMRPGNVWSGS